MTEQLDDVKHPDGALNGVLTLQQTSKSFGAGTANREQVLSLLDDEN